MLGLVIWRSCNSPDSRALAEVSAEVEAESSIVLDSYRELEDDFFFFDVVGPNEVECFDAPVFTGSSSQMYFRYLLERSDQMPEQVGNIDDALTANGYFLEYQDLNRTIDTLLTDFDTEGEGRPFQLLYSHQDNATSSEVEFSGEDGDGIEITFYSSCFRPSD